MAKTYKEVWDILSKIDCSEHIEKKGGFNYLSWVWALGIMMEHFPEHKIEIHENDDGYPCFYNPQGYGMVKVTVWIGELDRTEKFPVLDYRNKAVQNPESFQENTSKWRAYVKTLAQFGLGHYIYAGEDLPKSIDTQKKTEAKATKKQVKTIETFLDECTDGDVKLQRLLDWGCVDNLSELSNAKARQWIAQNMKVDIIA